MVTGGFQRIGSTSDILGESPVWSAADEAFYWVDIRGKLIRRWVPGTDSVQSWETPSLVGCIVPRRSGGLVVGLADGIAHFSPASGMFSAAYKLPLLNAAQRLNDGKCDSGGRLWVGSMNIETREPDGRLYRLDPDGTVELVLDGLAVPNSLCWNRADDGMYFSQTRDRRILRYAFDSETGSLGEASVVYEVTEPGVPDGATVDVDDTLWVAEFGNGRLTLLANGDRLPRHVDLPCTYPTSCAFGGPDLDMVLVTSASVRLSAEERAASPHEGGTFAAKVDRRGVLPNSFDT